MRTLFLPFLFLYIISLFAFKNLQATHILGGEISYICNGGNSITITLNLYYDCNSSTGVESQAKIFIRDMNGNYITPFSEPNNYIILPKTDEIDLSPNFNPECLTNIPNICRTKVVHTKTLNINPVAGGFDLMYQRCCRPSGLDNITSGGVGSTYIIHVPHSPGSECDNSSPVFNEDPPVIIGAEFLQSFDYSATDADGDQLVYTLCYPLTGAEGTCNDLGSAGCPDFPFNINPVNWINGYSLNNQLGGLPVFNVSNMGIVNCKPSSTGSFVTAVCVEEYRNGVLLSVTKRDFTFVIAEVESINTELSNGILNPDGTINLYECNDLEVEFHNSSVGADSYFWNFGDPASGALNTSTSHTPSHTYPATGNYEVMLIAYSGICNDTAIIHLTIRPGFESNFNYEGTICAGLPIQFYDLTEENFGNIISWLWDFGDAQSMDQNPIRIFENSGPQTVSLTVTTNTGCVLQTTQSINISGGPAVNLAAEDVICEGDTYMLNATIDSSADSFSWSPASGLSSTSIANPLVDIDTTSIYTLSATDATGCITTEEITLYYYQPIDLALEDRTLCEGEDTQVFLTNVTQASWSPEEGIDDANSLSPVFSPAVTTTFTVVASNDCFQGTDSFVLTISVIGQVNAGADATLFAGESITLNGSANPPFHWEPAIGLSDPSLLNPIANPAVTTTYTLISGDDGDCENSDEVVISVDSEAHIYIPTAFSPNGDGANDILRFTTRGIKEILEFSIYDRWGKRIFSSTSGDPGWNGLLGAATCEVGIYVYYIRAIDYLDNSTIQKGNVTLIR